MKDVWMPHWCFYVEDGDLPILFDTIYYDEKVADEEAEFKKLVCSSRIKPILLDPFTVVHEGKVIFKLEDPVWITKITATLLSR